MNFNIYEDKKVLESNNELQEEKKEVKKIKKKETSVSKKNIIKKVKKKISLKSDKSKPVTTKNTTTSKSIIRKKTSIKKTTADKKIVNVYFIRYLENEDKIVLVPVKRTIKSTSSPLRETLNLLLLGPTDIEDEKGYTSSIPGGVKIISLSIKNNIAYINLNKAFEFGAGTKIMKSRVYQIVYTATQYPTVEKVQILIEGRKISNFAGEGIDLSHPIGRLGMAKF